MGDGRTVNIMETMKTITELAKKGMTVELQEKIVELREEVIGLKEENIQLKEENLALKQEIEGYTQGEQCPKCRKASWELVDSIPHPVMGDVGIIERTYKCSECGFSEKKIHTPDRE